MKKVLALALATMMVLALFSVALANETSSHVLTITNTDQYVTHDFVAYQVFVGKADGTGTKLSDVKWGNGVNAAGIVSAIQSSVDTDLAVLKNELLSLDYTDADQVASAAAKIAEKLSTSYLSTNQTPTTAAGALDKFASIVAANLSSTAVALTPDATDDTTYSGTVKGDGYYIVIDDTATLKGTNGSDTKSKNILLPVLKNTTAVAKDTGMTPDKEIVEGSARLKEGTAAIGDTITFEVKIPVPNTTKYIDHFCFQMQDTLPVGMTFMGITSVKVGSDNVPYALTVAPAGSSAYVDYTAPADAAAAVTTAGGQKIKVVFTNFKANAEANNCAWIGQDLVVTYTAVVNDDADYTPTGNINEVVFDYSNDPNHVYNGDEPGSSEPHGTTPESTTKTLLVNIEVLKTDGAGAPLAGAEFEITSDDYNVTLLTGEKFEAEPYTAATGETIEAGTYYKLLDGSYTTTVPDSTNSTAYDSTTQTYVKVSFTKVNTTPGTAKKITVISGEDGKIVLNGLKPGTYTIKETKAPTGYNLDSTEHPIVISATYNTTTKQQEIDGTVDGSATGWDGTTATASITIVNKAGTELPSTGGIGTTIFYVSGLVMVLGAAIILVARRRADAE